jgi:branched-chain amino acid transport system ATP-binding protein
VSAAQDALLECRGLAAGYGSVAVVHDLDLRVAAGEVVALIGPNGAGKTTTLLALAGELPPVAGEVVFRGARTTAPLFRRAQQGLGFVTEERSVFCACRPLTTCGSPGSAVPTRPRCSPSSSR